jgi:hypothetical protein
MDACDCFSLSPSCVAAVVGLVSEKDFDCAQIHRESPAAFLVLEWVLCTLRCFSLWRTLLASFGDTTKRAEHLLRTAEQSQIREEQRAQARQGDQTMGLTLARPRTGGPICTHPTSSRVLPCPI